MDTKSCSKCGEEKSLDSFGKKANGRGGLQARCRVCLAEENLAWKQKNPEQMKAIVAKSNKERAEAKREWNRNNVEAVRASKKKHRQKNRAAINEATRQWKAENGDCVRASATKRRAAKLKRTPSWANDQLIAAYYSEAKRLEELTGIQFHVDHIIPLQGGMVSGLHVETNLQLLPAHENQGKSNRFDPETFVA